MKLQGCYGIRVYNIRLAVISWIGFYGVDFFAVVNCSLPSRGKSSVLLQQRLRHRRRWYFHQENSTILALRLPLRPTRHRVRMAAREWLQNELLVKNRLTGNAPTLLSTTGLPASAPVAALSAPPPPPALAAPSPALALTTAPPATATVPDNDTEMDDAHVEDLHFSSSVRHARFYLQLQLQFQYQCQCSYRSDFRTLASTNSTNLERLLIHLEEDNGCESRNIAIGSFCT